MAINIQTAINHMTGLKNRGVKYSMYGSRTGSDGTADCSGAVYASLRAGGASDAGYVLSTETMHSWLTKNGFKLIAENKEWNAQKGDVFIWGKRGQSAGAGGHTGIFVDANNIIHCNYGRNGVTIDNHDAVWAQSGRMYWYAYRYQGTAASNPAPAPTPSIKAPVATPQSQGNRGCLDAFAVQGGRIIVRGWHFYNADAEWIFLMDAATGKELARVQAPGKSRPDVLRAYPYFNWTNTGFDVSFDANKFKGKTVYILARATDDPKGNTQGRCGNMIFSKLLKV